MRIFIALDIDDSIRERIKRFMEGVRGFDPEARWVRPESLHITLKFIGEKPPQNMTLHGAHDFHSGGEIGSVSAASSAFSAQIGKQFKRVANTLTIG